MDHCVRCVRFCCFSFFYFFFARGPKRLYIFERWVRICRSSKENSLVVVATFVPPRFPFQFFFYRGVCVYFNWRRQPNKQFFLLRSVPFCSFLAIYVLLQAVLTISCAHISRVSGKRKYFEFLWMTQLKATRNWVNFGSTSVSLLETSIKFSGCSISTILSHFLRTTPIS